MLHIKMNSTHYNKNMGYNNRTQAKDLMFCNKLNQTSSCIGGCSL